MSSSEKPIVGILLAAGRSSRFGSDKVMHHLPDGRPMAVAAASNFITACDKVIAVLRPDSEKLNRLLIDAGCETVICTSADAGMGYSLATGVSASREAAGWVVALADMPFITSASHRVVVNSLRKGASIAACEFNGRRGHPVGFADRWHDQLVGLTGDHGAKPILEAHQQQLVLCSVDDPGVVRDIDWPEDL